MSGMFLILHTVDGQNIQTLQHALCWTPAPPNLNVSARVLAKVMLGVWFFSSIGANALQVTITLNFGGEGVVPDRRGLNISSIYGISSLHPTYCVCSKTLWVSCKPNLKTKRPRIGMGGLKQPDCLPYEHFMSLYLYVYCVYMIYNIISNSIIKYDWI